MAATAMTVPDMTIIVANFIGIGEAYHILQCAPRSQVYPTVVVAIGSSRRGGEIPFWIAEGPNANKHRDQFPYCPGGPLIFSGHRAPKATFKPANLLYDRNRRARRKTIRTNRKQQK